MPICVFDLLPRDSAYALVGIVRSNNLMLIIIARSRLPESQQMEQSVQEEALRPKHISTLDIVNNLGLLHADLLYVDQGKLAEVNVV
jgi:hypothetical protein